MEVDNSIDEGLYSRQIYVLGEEAMKKMTVSKILIIGMKGLGVEIAKNVILTGVKSVTLYDKNPVEIKDMSTNFYLKESDVGKSRADCCLQSLSELNMYVPVNVYSGELTEDFIKGFRVVVYTFLNTNEEIYLDSICHQHSICFISATTTGLCGKIFCDFGDTFIVQDKDCEDPKSVLVGDITNEKEGVVSVFEGRHEFEEGDYVTFTDVDGMTELNGCEPRQVHILGPLAFTIGDTTNYKPYTGHGWCVEVKQPVTLHFKSYKEAIQSPGEFLITDYGKFTSSINLHIAYLTLDIFINKYNRYPAPYSEEDAEKLYTEAEILNKQLDQAYQTELDKKFIYKFAYTCQGDLSPITAAFGGIIAQEVLKACTSKFTPITQYMYMDHFEALPDTQPQDYEPLNCRYDGQIVIYGREYQERIQNLRFFLVGAGAIGCEVIKNFAMMGLSTGEKGHLFVTDMDRIEKSNLSRQFLFRTTDIGESKSVTAAKAIQNMNNNMHITCYETKVCPETENLFNIPFWENLDGVCNALDNIQARLYTDKKCVEFQKCLLESGTLGAKGNTQIVVPHLTENYGASSDPAEKSIPMCTLKNFPYQIEHCIQYVRDKFEGLFSTSASNVLQYIENPSFLAEQRTKPATYPEVVTSIYDAIMKAPHSYYDCIQWAINVFYDQFNISIKSLLKCFPPDHVSSNGERFWSGSKRVPTPIDLDIHNPLHYDFIHYTSLLCANMYNIPINDNEQFILSSVSTCSIPVYDSANDNTRINPDEKSNETHYVSSDEQATKVKTMISQLPTPDTLKTFSIQPLEFEKDDDSNHHIDFITAASNLRATNYGIPTADRQTTKKIAGKIIPAIATTTSLVTGMICLELYKILLNKPIEAYRNMFVNLSLPLFAFSEPVACEKFSSNGMEFSLWDRININKTGTGSLTLQEIVNIIKEKYNCNVDMVCRGEALIYNTFGDKNTRERRLQMTVEAVTEEILKGPLPKGTNCLVLDFSCSDDDYETIELPRVYYYFTCKN